METSTEKNELIFIINELKQKLKTDGQLLATNAYYETSSHIDYDKETGIFLYSHLQVMGFFKVVMKWWICNPFLTPPKRRGSEEFLDNTN